MRPQAERLNMTYLVSETLKLTTQIEYCHMNSEQSDCRRYIDVPHARRPTHD